MPTPAASAQQTFEDLLRDLPPDFQDMAIEFRAFTRPRKVRSPLELMRLVLMYSGIGQTLRDVAGNLTLLRERITDTAVQKRLSACVPWLKALLQKMWPGLVLYATLLVKRPHRLFGADNLGAGRDITPWRLWRMLDNEAAALITSVLHWQPSQRKVALEVLKERPRKRKLQTLPLSVARMVTNWTGGLA